jgi:hypothetical protein
MRAGFRLIVTAFAVLGLVPAADLAAGLGPNAYITLTPLTIAGQVEAVRLRVTKGGLATDEETCFAGDGWQGGHDVGRSRYSIRRPAAQLNPDAVAW